MTVELNQIWEKEVAAFKKAYPSMGYSYWCDIAEAYFLAESERCTDDEAKAICAALTLREFAAHWLKPRRTDYAK